MFAEPRIQEHGNQLFVSHGDDSKLYVEFHQEAEKQGFESEQSGHAVFKNIDYITIMFPGDQTKKVVRPVREFSDENNPADSERFPRQWQRYKNQEAQIQDGFPLEQFPPMTKADVQMLKASGVHTVEALANIPDAAIDGLGLGSRKFKQIAISFLDKSNNGEAVSKLLSENEQLKSQIAALQAQVNEIISLNKKGQK